MAVAFRAATSGTYSATASPVVTNPGVSDGDAILVCFGSDTTHTLTTPAGWNLISNTDNGTDTTVSVIWRIASSEPGSWTFTTLFNATESGAYGVTSYSGADQATPINQSAAGTTTSVATKSGPSVTPSVDDCMIVQFGGCDPPSGAFNATPDTSPVGNERFDQTNSALGWTYCQDSLQGVAAAIALDHVTSSAVTTVAMQVAVAPAAAAAAAPPNLVMAPYQGAY